MPEPIIEPKTDEQKELKPTEPLNIMAEPKEPKAPRIKHEFSNKIDLSPILDEISGLSAKLEKVLTPAPAPKAPEKSYRIGDEFDLFEGGI